MANIDLTGATGNIWWSRILVTAVGAADLKVIPTATAAGSGRQRRLALTWFTILGHNTNAAATTFVVRNKTTTANVFFGGSMLPVSGSIQTTSSGIFIAGAANETIELVVAGAITGQIDISCGGRFLPADYATVDKYTGAP